jgi:glutaminyl-peptide cyclotransferase
VPPRERFSAVPPSAATGRRGRYIVLLVLVAVLIGAGGWLLPSGATPTVATASDHWQIPSHFDADRAFGYLEQIVAIGPRISGTAGMEQQQQMLLQFFADQGAQTQLQAFEVRHPQTGEPTTLANLVARFRPEAAKRYLLCAHYDTRPYPDRDPIDPRGVFLGANDGASGVAALMEFSHHLDRLPPHVGIDLVLFDAEELVYDDARDPYFLGSIYFSRNYVADPEWPRYEAGVLLDMVGDRELHLFYERNSWHYAREVTREIWATAARLGIDAFQPRLRHEVRDDHIPLNTSAKIPTVDIIDFDYPRPGWRVQSYWHTREDTPDKCSGRSLVAVVYVVHTWLMSK